MKCFDGMSAATVNDIDERISRLCTSMYMDNIDIEGGDYPNKDQDLFMENSNDYNLLMFSDLIIELSSLHLRLQWLRFVS